MSDQLQFYVTDLLILFFVNLIAIYGLHLQYSVTGIYNFAFVIFQAAGAYTAAVLTLGPDTSNGGFQHYILGAELPYPLSVLAAGAVGGLLAIPIGFVGLFRLRGDYQAVVMLVISLIATGVITAQIGLFNGPAGLALIPQPLSTFFDSQVTYNWFYVGIASAWCLVAYWVVRGITAAPLGRILRAVRDSDTAASALGKDVTRLRLMAFIIGGVLAGISGAVYVQNLGAWSPAAWFYPETFLLFTAVVVGGTGNMLGAAVGALLVPIVFQEVTRFLPDIGYPGMINSLDWVAIGLLLLIFIWARPRGLVPERRRRFATAAALPQQNGRTSLPVSEASIEATWPERSQSQAPPHEGRETRG
jgi:branched-chain amino acid transport system permease protein